LDTEELIAQSELSPCVGVCKLDQDSGWCFGCGRTGAEIRDWQEYSEAERVSLEASLPDRVQQLIDRRRQERGPKRSGRRSRG